MIRTCRRLFALAFCALLISSAARGQAFSIVHSFSSEGGYPLAGLLAASDGKLYGTTAYGGVYGRGNAFSLTPDGAGGYGYSEIYVASPTGGVGGLMGPLLEASDGYFYGTSWLDGAGTIFRIDAAGQLTVVHVFSSVEGVYPQALIEASDGYFYGAALSGGAGDSGTLFRMDVSGNVTVLQNFSGSNGVNPVGRLLEGSDGSFYGVTESGGWSNLGTVFRFGLGDGLTTLRSFGGPDGSLPEAGLMQADDGLIYGTTSMGGAESVGTIFRLDASGVPTTVHDFSVAEAGGSHSTLLQASDGSFYGTTWASVVRMDSAGVVTVLHNFTPAEGVYPYGALVESGGRFLGANSTQGTGGHGTVFAVDSSGASTLIHAFDGSPEGAGPSATLLAASDGALYGTTVRGGAFGGGAVFRMDLSGNMTVVHGFEFADGASSTGKLLEVGNGTFYGTSSQGGSPLFPGGTVFRIDPDGAFTVLHEFDGNEGYGPHAGLILASDGYFYGTAELGGLHGYGSLFRMTESGFVAILHDFDGTDGAHPVGGLVEAGDGGFYGTTSYGGASDFGTIFRLDPSRYLSTIRSFSGSDGKRPLAGLVQATDGGLYGITSKGGAGDYAFGVAFRTEGFDDYSDLHDFAVPEGSNSNADLLQASDGQFYGTTYDGGAAYGTVFRVAPNGDFALLHTFIGDDGFFPTGGMAQGADGSVYGTASGGGLLGGGVLFRVDPSLAISVSSLTPGGGSSSGGTPLAIAGTGFGGTTLVLIGGAAAGGFVVDDTHMTAVSPPLPPGAAYDLTVYSSAQMQIIRKAWFVDALDVPPSDLFYDAVRRVLLDGVSVGCGGGLYCRDGAVTRAQMAVLLLKAKMGTAYVPPPATGLYFFDVFEYSFAAAWIEDLAFRGITIGCGSGNYCPDAPITRAVLAPLLLKALLGPAYAPPSATGTVFGDVATDAFAADWIEDLAARGIAAGCHAQPALYCPGAPVTRAQMAALLVSAFGLH